MSSARSGAFLANSPAGFGTPPPHNLSSPTFPPSSPTRPSSMYRTTSPSRSPSRLAQGDTDKVSVNVSVRIRPPLDEIGLSSSLPQSPSLAKGAKPLAASSAPSSSSVVESSTFNSVTVSRKKFTYDNVFDEATSQQGVWNYISQCVGKFVQGYNVTIMAYGQSGSGKSYTMGTTDDPGSVRDEENMGITQRAANNLFGELKRSSTTGLESGRSGRGSPAPTKIRPPSINFSDKNRLGDGVVDERLDCQPWTVSVSYLEIYNEQLRDLLDGKGDTDKKMAIREDVKGNIMVKGIKEVVVNDTDSLLAVLEQGSRARQTNSTAINTQSSRSHAIFTIHLTQKQLNPDTGIITTVTSKLNLVDLAGSERLKNTGSTTEGRVREGISINSGLSSLGKVISQLSLNSNGGSHVSYRDSKLTRALQDSIGGKAITYLIACITTESLYLSETINTLTYAQRARSIQSAPEIQTIEASKEELLRSVQQLQRELSLIKNSNSNNQSSSAHSSPLLNGGSQFFTPTTPVTNRESAVFSPGSETSRERVMRSTEFQSAVEGIISDYELTVKSLQESCRMSQEATAELTDTLAQTRLELQEALNANEELGDLVEQLQTRLDASITKASEPSSTLGSREDTQKKDEQSYGSKITELEKELVAYRQEHKRHMTESQYLTSQYNNARKEMIKLQKERDEMELKLRRYEHNPHLSYKQRISVPDVTEEEEEGVEKDEQERDDGEAHDQEDEEYENNGSDSSIGGDESNGPHTPPSMSNLGFKQDFSMRTSHRRTLSLASSSSTEKTPRSERRRSSFFVRASVM